MDLRYDFKTQTYFSDCDVCGALFQTKRRHTSTCSPKCRKAKSRKAALPAALRRAAGTTAKRRKAAAGSHLGKRPAPPMHTAPAIAGPHAVGVKAKAGVRRPARSKKS
jgi:hypothetical protein